MKSLYQQINEVLTNSGPKITRDAFLFMKGDRADFAQCSSCREFVKNRGLCAGMDDSVSPGGSCGMYVEGKYDGQSIRKQFTKEEAGYVDRKVRCENCKYGGKKCALYDMLNKKLPEVFSLDTKIDSKDCCNANTPAKKTS